MRVGAVVLAAGCSTRFGPENKLLADVGGSAMIKVVVETMAQAVGIANLLAVTGFDRAAVEQMLAPTAVRTVFNEKWSEGMGSSIAFGIGKVDPDLDGVFIVPGDMPLITQDLLQCLIAQFTAASGATIVFPTTVAGEQRTPVLWPRKYFPDLAALQGPEGGKRLLGGLAAHWSPVRATDDNQLLDIDEPGLLGKTDTYL
jgi:molybdenum cofactor cytidylyltransferase